MLVVAVAVVLLFCAWNVLASYLFWPGTIGADRTTEAPARLLLGTAVTVLAMRFAAQYMSGATAARLAFVAITALSLIAWVIRRRRFQWRARRLRAGGFLIAAGMLGFVRLWPLADFHAIVPFEGTGNHDEFYYIFLAQRLYETSWSTIVSGALDGVSLITSAAMLPRFGAELIMVFFATIGGISIPASHPLASAAGSVLWVAGALLVFATCLGPRSRTRVAAMVVIVLSPAAAYIVANNNLATLFGTAFVAGFGWALATCLQPEATAASGWRAGALLAATLTCYVELIPVVMFVSFAVLLAAWASAGQFARLPLRNLALVPLSCLILHPHVFADASATWERHRQTAADSISWTSLFDYHDVSWGMLTTLTASPTTVSLLPAWVIAGFCVALAGAAVPVMNRRLANVWLPLTGGGLITLGLALRYDMHYTEYKAVQLLGIPACVLVALIATEIVARARARFGSPAHARTHALIAVDRLAPVWLFCGAAIVALWFKAFAHDYALYGELAKVKHQSTDVRTLVDAGRALPAGAVLYVSADLGENPFFKSRWIAYMLRDRPLVFHPRYHGGGYLHDLDVAYNRDLWKITHIVAGIDRGPRLPATRAPIFANHMFQVVDLGRENFVEMYGGFHDDEEWFRWMADKAVIRVFGVAGNFLHVQFLGRFEPAAGEESILVTVGQWSKRYPIPRGTGTIDIPLPPGAIRDVLLEPDLVAISPKELGQSLDNRQLTFRVGAVSIE